MRSAVRFSAVPVRCLLAVLFAVCFAGSAFSQTTTFSGTVYSPFGPTKGSLGYAGDPIPNILVFVQDSFPADIASGQGTLPAFTQGVNIPTSGQTGCSANPQTALVPKSVLGSALTTSAGTFTFNVTGALPDPVVIVIQAGKWRKQYSYPLASLVTSGLQLTMPSAQVAGPTGQANLADLPHIAVVTGDADQVECIFQQIGIAGTEITDPSGTGSINLFEGDGAGGSEVSSSSPRESALLNGTIPMTNYDLVIFGCQGSPTADPDPAKYATTSATSVIPAYTADSGRLLLTHYGWPYISDSFGSSVATFNASTPNAESLDTAVGQLNTAYSGYAVLEGWMNDIGALTSTNPPDFKLTNARGDVKTTGPAVDVWATVPSIANPTIQFSFDTPLGQAGTPTVTVAYTNNTTQFVAGDTNDTITVNVTNTGTVATSGTALSLTLQLPSSFTNISVTDPTGGWSCPVTGSVASCTHVSPLGAGVSDSVVLTFGISSTAAPGPVSISSTIAGGNLNNSEQCGRVLFNDYHVEEPVGNGGKTGSTYAFSSCPAVSTSGLSAAQKFLEYSLYALSNFVSPSTSDAIQIMVKPTVTWSTTTLVPYYGTPLNQIETGATANVPGTFAYTYTPNTGANPLDVGSYTFTATFTPTDTTDYLTNSTTAQVNVLQDPTQSMISNLSGSIYYGQEIGYDATLGSAALSTKVIAPGYTGQAVNAGSYAVSLNGTTVCTGTAGTALTAGKGPGGCADAAFSGLNAGTYTLGFAYAGTTDFGASSASTTSVTIKPDPTATTVAASLATAPVHTNLTFTASTADTYAPAVGTINFYDSLTAVAANPGTPGTPNTIPVPAGAVLIGTQPLAAGGTATLSLANLTVGTHNVIACFAGPVNSSSTYNFVDSCSASVPEVITVPPAAPLSTQTFLATSQNPAALGQAVSFTATVATTGAFSVVPTGTVTFTADGVTIGTAQLGAAGTAVYTTSSLTLGTHAIVASYGGSTTMAVSTSATLSEVIQDPLAAAGNGFLLEISPSPTVSVPVGGSAVVTIQIVELTNFNQPVQLSCSGLPAESSCTFAQSLVPASGGTTQLLLSASSPHNCNSSGEYFVSGTAWGWPLFGLSLMTLCVARRRKKLQAVALTALLIALPSMLSGCGGNCTDFGVKPGTYSFTITATSKGSPSVVKSQTMTMNAHL